MAAVAESSSSAAGYQAILVVSFGGPEGPDEVLPFLENVLRGRPVPRQRLLEVAEHYHHFGGVSPINAQNRALVAALQAELDQHGPRWKVYWGNRNWRPLLPDALAQMTHDGVERALAFVTSAYSSYSGCRQYRENLAAAQAEVGPKAPALHKLRVFFNHPGFIGPAAANTRLALAQLPAGARVKLLFTAHSIPQAMADTCAYVQQLREASRLVADEVGALDWELVYQSRSGPPTQPWLGPDVNDAIVAAQRSGAEALCLVPIGFTSDHMEVLYDLDVEARATAERLGIPLVRAATVGCAPEFVAMIRELILERIDPAAPRRALGPLGPWHDTCPADCCPRS